MSDNPKCFHDYANALRIGRGHYLCPKCGEDISLIVFLIAEAEMDDATVAAIKKNKPETN